MKALYSNCIFCGCDLDETNRSREHIVPQIIMGSFISQDVCRCCNSKLSEADKLILNDPRIIQAINCLELSDIQNNILRIGETIGTDTQDGAERRFHMKDGHPILIPKPSFTGERVADIDNTLPLLRTLLSRDKELNWPNEKAGRYIGEIVTPEFLKLKPHESIDLREAGYSIEMRQIGNIETHFPAISFQDHRLIAKIIYEISFYLLSPEIAESAMKDLDYYRDVAYGSIEREEGRLFTRSVELLNEPNYLHRIQISFSASSFLTVDIDLFASVNYHAIIRTDRTYPLPILNSRQVTAVGLGMTFNDTSNRHFAIRYFNDADWAVERFDDGEEQ
ncbi:MAG: HNH endonuclease [Calditrichaeota bacterium]|nr:HNH endonuclease [Calditrichota bacterium]